MDERVPNARPTLPVVIERPAVHGQTSVGGTVLASLGMATVVVLVLYGMSRPDAPRQTASAPSETAQSAPAGGGGQGAQAAKPEPSTTGQAPGGAPDKQQPDKGKAQRSDSATTNAKPSDQPKAPQQ